jgi:uncharacterized membrane protein
MFEDFMAVPAITILCMLAAQAYKTLTKLDNSNIPVLCGACGAILGVVCYLSVSGIIPANDPVTAAAIGAVSGWAGTGINQMVKQKTKPPNIPLEL